VKVLLARCRLQHQDHRERGIYSGSAPAVLRSVRNTSCASAALETRTVDLAGSGKIGLSVRYEWPTEIEVPCERDRAGRVMSDEEDLEAHARARLGTEIRGKYRIDAILGMGGMAVVYKATHRNKAELAIKMLHPQLSARSSVRARFLREAYAANSVRHPGAVRVVDDDVTEDGAAFLVMELLDGLSVDHLLDRSGGVLPVQVTVAIALQLLDVLAAAHAAGIVHRDIKPANLFVTRDGSVKVLDFGIARALDDTTGAAQLTGAGVPIGTPAFMAPEQALAQSSQIDAQTDVWAAGATLFAMLSGQPVHAGEVTAQVVVAAATTPARSLACVAPSAPVPIAEVVDRALAFDKAQRWADAGAMRDALVEACAAASLQTPGRDALASHFGSVVVGKHSNVPAAFAPTAESMPSLPVAGSHAPTGPAVSSTKRPEVSRGTRRVVTVAIGSVALAGAVAAGVVAWRGRAVDVVRTTAAPSAAASAAPAGSRIQVLILSMDNRTGDPLFDGAVDVILAAAVNRSPLLASLPRSSLGGLAAELDAGTEIDERLPRLLLARDGGRVVGVRGSLSERGAGYTLTLSAVDARTGATVLDARREAADAAGVVPSLGRLACDLRAALGDSPPTDPHDAEQTGMSSFIEADHEAILGGALVNTGKYEEAIRHLKRAVEIDPTFAKGHWVLANVLINTGNRVEGRREYELAVQNASGLTELNRAKVQAGYFEAIGAYDRAIAPLEEALRRDPHDAHIQTELSQVLVETNQIRRAVEVAQSTTTEFPTLVIAWTNLAGAELRASDADHAVEHARKALDEFPHPPPHASVFLALAEAMQGHTQDASDAYGRLHAHDASLATLGLGDLALAEGRWTDAETLLRDGIDADVSSHATEAADRKRVVLAEALLARGDRAGALAAARKVAPSSDSATLYGAAEVQMEAGDAKGATSIADELGKAVSQDARLFSKILEGALLRKAGKPRDALARLADARDISDAWLVHVELARAHLDLGEAALAERELRECLARRGEGTLAYGDDAPSWRLVPPVTYYLARALEALHSPEAKATYEAYVALAARAERDPRADDARRRASKL
jgi:serine/threonine protein kinase/predicted Zn-dependent protease